MARRDSIALQSCSLKMKFQSKLQICTSENKRLRRAPFPRVPPISSRMERRCLSQPLEWSLLGGIRAWDRLDGQISYTKARFSRPPAICVGFRREIRPPRFHAYANRRAIFFSRLKSCTEALRGRLTTCISDIWTNTTLNRVTTTK